MYSLVTMEDTIRIPAEYIRKGRKLEEHIDDLAHAAFEGRFDEDENYTLLTYDHETVGRGKNHPRRWCNLPKSSLQSFTFHYGSQ